MSLTGVSTSVVDMSGDTTGLVIAKGTTAERDAISSPQAGMIRNNTETDRVEVYNGTDWRNLVEAGNAAPLLTVDYLVVGGGGGAGEPGALAAIAGGRHRGSRRRVVRARLLGPRTQPASHRVARAPPAALEGHS